MAVPRLPLPGGREDVVTLPHPLEAGTAARLRRIFALQRSGDVPAAIAETRMLDDETLLGDVLAQRYLSPRAKPEPDQLRLWLKSFFDLPDAPAIYQLLAGVGHGVHPGPVPSAAILGIESPAAPLPEEADPADHAFSRSAALDRAVQERLAGGSAGATGALHLIAANRHIDRLYAAQLRAEVALHQFAANDTDAALATAQAAFEASDGRIGLAGYVAGLAAWRAERTDQARPLFEAASRAELTSASIRAGAAFWAARTHLRGGDQAGYQPWLQRAAATPRTFYGFLATRLLGRLGGSWDRPWSQPMQLASLGGLPLGDDDAEPDDAEAGQPSLSEIDVEAVAATPAGRRAFALLQIGEIGRAEATLRRLWPMVQTDMALCRSIQLVADAAGLATLSAQLASILQSRDGQPREQARFPVPHLSPHHGFIINPALVYALTRLESNFDASAVSEAGAHGLMQLMPVTAGFVLGHPDRYTDDPAPLQNAALNLEIGQRYLGYLSKQTGVDGDLVRLLASYNAGPNAVIRWNATIDSEHDPLLFIESLPSDQTRDYVRRAFTYLWTYAERMHLPSPSLVSLAAGRWPSFADEQLAGRMVH